MSENEEDQTGKLDAEELLHTACLQFHHRDKKEKNFTISNAVLRDTSIKTLIRKIEKCDVLCVNCHAK